MGKKILIIERCGDCYSLIADLNLGCFICNKTKSEIIYGDIPKNCPLDDYDNCLTQGFKK